MNKETLDKCLSLPVGTVIALLRIGVTNDVILVCGTGEDWVGVDSNFEVYGPAILEDYYDNFAKVESKSDIGFFMEDFQDKVDWVNNGLNAFRKLHP